MGYFCWRRPAVFPPKQVRHCVNLYRFINVVCGNFPAFWRRWVQLWPLNGAVCHVAVKIGSLSPPAPPSERGEDDSSTGTNEAWKVGNCHRLKTALPDTSSAEFRLCNVPHVTVKADDFYWRLDGADDIWQWAIIQRKWDQIIDMLRSAFNGEWFYRGIKSSKDVRNYKAGFKMEAITRS